MVCSSNGSPSPWRLSYSSAKSNGLCVNNEDQVPKRGKSKLGDPPPTTVQRDSAEVRNGERGISGGASKNRATRGSGATGGSVEEARQESRAAGARARLSTEEADGGQFFMNIDFE